jgi:hypothetical protein
MMAADKFVAGLPRSATALNLQASDQFDVPAVATRTGSGR